MFSKSNPIQLARKLLFFEKSLEKGLNVGSNNLCEPCVSIKFLIQSIFNSCLCHDTGASSTMIMSPVACR